MKNTQSALLWITNILERLSIPYKISGGFAARVHGVNRELADIDIEVSDDAIVRVAQEVAPYITYGPERYKDAQWDLELMTLNYEGQEIDIAGTGARIFNANSNQWEEKESRAFNPQIFEVYGKKVPVEHIESLIAYKTKLSREVDIEDIKQLNQLHIKK